MNIIIKLIKFYIGKTLHQRYPYRVTWYKKIWHNIVGGLRKTFVLGTFVASIALIAGLSAVIYRNANPKTVLAEKEVIKEIKIIPPVMNRIAKCESPKGQFENGKVVVRVNNDGSRDVGKYQINDRYWGLKAMELGFNLFTEEGNEKMAMWIYENKGTDPWIHSKPCWNR